MPTDAKAVAGPSAAPPDAKRQRERMLAIVAGVALVLGVVGIAAAVSGARMSSATMGLLAATGALLLCLRALYRLASALTRPGIETALEQEALLGVASQRELREEKRRLVRAINELTFDHEMGKLSAADYEAVKERYQLQAVSVMRALKDDRDLHPGLLAELQKLDPSPSPSPSPDPQPNPSPESDAVAPTSVGGASDPDTDTKNAESESTRACAACETSNDPDARFCKQCGAPMTGANA